MILARQPPPLIFFVDTCIHILASSVELTKLDLCCTVAVSSAKLDASPHCDTNAIELCTVRLVGYTRPLTYLAITLLSYKYILLTQESPRS